MSLTNNLRATAMTILLWSIACQTFAQTGDTTVTISRSQMKMLESMKIVASMFMDSIPEDKLCEIAIKCLLEKIDSHSRYYTPEEAAADKAQMSSKPVGAGFECRIFNDTAVVVRVSEKGPAFRAGIKPGDRLDSIGNADVSNRHLSQDSLNRIIESLTGNSTSVVVIQRKGTKCVRMPIDSTAADSGIEAHYAPSDTSLYIKISKFRKETYDSFCATIKQYPKKRLRNIILDLRDNPGGIYNSSVSISNMFLKKDEQVSKKIGRGKSHPLFANEKGPLYGSRVYVLINENTASSSEVVASCLQDCDQGVIIGRRSFGKAVSQQKYELSDGSAIRLSNYRLISPSGRCIERDPAKKLGIYSTETAIRRARGENVSAAKMPKPDEGDAYETVYAKRKVYGGIGVVPDVFVAEKCDTLPCRWQEWLDLGLIDDFAITYTCRHRAGLQKAFRNFETFKQEFSITQQIADELAEFLRQDSRAGNSSNECLRQRIPAINNIITSKFAWALYGASECREILNQTDADFQEAMRLISSPSEYRKILKTSLYSWRAGNLPFCRNQGHNIWEKKIAPNRKP